MYSEDMRYSLNLKLYRQHKFFGPGIKRLLESIKENSSLRMASVQMEMAYSKAWKMIKVAEKNLGFPLLETKTGGKGGGGAVLTDQAQEFLIIYDDFEKAVYAKTEEIWQQYSTDFYKVINCNTEENDQQSQTIKVVALVMASGYSRRMGCNKMLLNLGEQTVIDYIMEQILRIGYHEKMVVSQYEEILAMAKAKGFLTVLNNQAIKGKSSSIRAGLQALTDVDGYCFFTGDQILISDTLLKQLLETFKQDPSRIVFPVFNGEWGSPSIFPSDLREELLKVTAEQGGRPVAEKYKERVALVEVEDSWQGLDFDTPEEWIFINEMRKKIWNKN